MNFKAKLQKVLESKKEDDEELLRVDTKDFTPKQKKKREEVMDSLKKREKEYRAKYGENWMKVMQATASQMAEEVDEHELLEYKNQPDTTPDDGGFKIDDPINDPKGTMTRVAEKGNKKKLLGKLNMNNPYDPYDRMSPTKSEEVKSSTDKLKVDYSKVKGQSTNPHPTAKLATLYPKVKKEEVEQLDEVSVGDKVSFEHPMTAIPGKTMKKVGTVHKIEGDIAHLKSSTKYGTLRYTKKVSELTKESVESLDELSPATKASYVAKAKDQIKQSRPFTKKSDEYRDIAKNFIAKREKGIAKANEETEDLQEKDLSDYISSLGYEPKFMDKSNKLKYAQSDKFSKWKMSREESEKMTPHQKFKNSMKKAGYDMDAGAKRLEDLLAKQKKEREEREKPEVKETMMGKLANSYEPEDDLEQFDEHLSKAAMMVKGIFNKHKKRMTEETYDHEKDDKGGKSNGKQPKLEKSDEKDNAGEKKPSARAILSGGKTETGSPRDTVEIDPMMRNRPGQPDVTKKDDKDKDKDKKGKGQPGQEK